MQYMAFADGGCSKNGKIDAQAYGSYAVYLLPESEFPTFMDDPAKCAGLKPTLSDMRCAFNLNAGRQTNNLAEVMALQLLVSSVFATEILHPNNRLVICMDSQLVINQVQGIFNVTKPHLLKVYKEIYGVFHRFERQHGVQLNDDVLRWKQIPGTLMKVVLGH